MTAESPLPEKVEVAQLLLMQGSLFVHLDPRGVQVIVPPQYRSEPQLVLQVGFDMPVPISDLRVDEQGIFGRLSFNRSPFTCFVGWDAVFALAGDDGRGMVWPDSMPPEIGQEIEREAGRRPAPERTKEVSGNIQGMADVIEFSDNANKHRRTQGGLGRLNQKVPLQNSKHRREEKLPSYLRVVK